MDVPSQRQAEPPTRGFFLRAETEELLADKGHVSNQDTQVHPWSQECSILGWGGGGEGGRVVPSPGRGSVGPVPAQPSRPLVAPRPLQASTSYILISPRRAELKPS